MPETNISHPFKAVCLTLFPELFPGPLGASVTGAALNAGLWQLDALNLRDFASDKHRTVDDRPAGGGPGMVLRADIAGKAIDAGLAAAPEARRIYLSPRLWRWRRLPFWMRWCGCSPVWLGRRKALRMRALRITFWSIRTIQGRGSLKGGRSRMFCSMVTMRRSSNGASNRQKL